MFPTKHIVGVEKLGNACLNNVCYNIASLSLKHNLQFLFPFVLVSSLARWNCFSSFHVRSARCHVSFPFAFHVSIPLFVSRCDAVHSPPFLVDTLKSVDGIAVHVFARLGLMDERMDGALGRTDRCIHFFIEAIRGRIPTTDVPTRHPIPRAEPSSSHASTRGSFLSPSRRNSRLGFSDAGSLRSKGSVQKG